MKKTYQKPTMEVVVMRTSTIICTSVPEYPGPFSYVPGHQEDDEKLMA